MTDNTVFVNNVKLSELSSMKTGGLAEKCCFPEDEKQLISCIHALKSEKREYIVLGNMSNVLIPDGNIDFVPVVTTKMTKVEKTFDGNGKLHVYAFCGVKLTKLAFEICDMGYSGAQFAYGIPGTVGGAVFMNAGAYGSEIKEIAEFVDFYDAEKDEIIRIDKKDCGFGYRTSAFQEKKGVILGASFVFEKGDREEIMKEAKETMQKRVDKQPLEYPSCGSAFKRPEGYFAGKLIEDCGLKGISVGGAQISEKHAGFIINKGGATTKDVKELIELVQKEVKEKFDIELVPEIRIL